MGKSHLCGVQCPNASHHRLHVFICFTCHLKHRNVTLKRFHKVGKNQNCLKPYCLLINLVDWQKSHLQTNAPFFGQNSCQIIYKCSWCKTQTSRRVVKVTKIGSKVKRSLNLDLEVSLFSTFEQSSNLGVIFQQFTLSSLFTERNLLICLYLLRLYMYLAGLCTGLCKKYSISKK